jgi:hydrogenase maturation protease
MLCREESVTTPGERRAARMIGIGSQHGDDRLGWEVASRLRECLSQRVISRISTDPLDVISLDSQCEPLVIVDACRGAGLPGTIHRFEWPDPRIMAEGCISSHGIGLAASLELAARLGVLPDQVIVYAVEGTNAEPGDPLSPAVQAAIPTLVSRVMDEMARLEGPQLEHPESRDTFSGARE